MVDELWPNYCSTPCCPLSTGESVAAGGVKASFHFVLKTRSQNQTAAHLHLSVYQNTPGEWLTWMLSEPRARWVSGEKWAIGVSLVSNKWMIGGRCVSCWDTDLKENLFPYLTSHRFAASHLIGCWLAVDEGFRDRLHHYSTDHLSSGGSKCLIREKIQWAIFCLPLQQILPDLPRLVD